MVPSGWSRIALELVAEVRSGVAKGKTGLKAPIEVPYLRVANVQDGYVDLADVKTIEVEQDKVERYSLKYGDVLMNEGGDYDKLGRGDVWLGQIEPCLHQNHVFAVRPNQDIVDPFFLAALAASNYGKTYFLSCAKRSTNLASINSTQIKEFPVLVPPLPEQRKIAQILSTWDKAITTTEQLLANSQQQKKALMQQLLTGKKRLLDENGERFRGEWEKRKVGDLIIQHSEKSLINGQYPVLTSSRQGMMFQKDYYNGRDVASEDTTGYNVVPFGYFTYRHMSDDLIFSFNINELCEKGIVSTLYPVFKANEQKINPYLLRIILNEGGEFKRFSLEQKQGGSRTYMYLSKLKELRLHIPCLKEQQKIAAVLNAADEEISALQQKIEALKQEKKALMQQLLTGKRRVKVDEVEI